MLPSLLLSAMLPVCVGSGAGSSAFSQNFFLFAVGGSSDGSWLHFLSCVSDAVASCRGFSGASLCRLFLTGALAGARCPRDFFCAPWGAALPSSACTGFLFREAVACCLVVSGDVFTVFRASKPVSALTPAGKVSICSGLELIHALCHVEERESLYYHSYPCIHLGTHHASFAITRLLAHLIHWSR